MAGIKSLAKDTAIYGTSTIVGRFISWCLNPLYIYVLVPGEFGSNTVLYAWMALLQVILIYGLETGFFRFANDTAEGDPKVTYTTCLFSLTATLIPFLGLIALFINPISNFLGFSLHRDYVVMTAVIVAMEVFCALPYAYLRFQKRPFRFAGIKLLSILVIVLSNIFFLLICPWIYRHHPALISWFYDPGYGVGYILLSNVISSFIAMLTLSPEIFGIRWRFRKDLLKRILRYSFPLLVLGVAGTMNQSLDKILYPTLTSDMDGLGIYSANFKLAVIMVLFTQAFRYAYEPFIFAQNKDLDRTKSYADAMKYFIIFGLFIFLGVTFYLDLIRYLPIDPQYFSGLKIVPIIMIAELFFGIFFNLSLWYKLTDRTQWGAYFTLFGLLISVAINVIFVPRLGYIACAWAAFACYASMMILSYFVGQRYFPIRYDLRVIAKYTVLSLVLYGLSIFVPIGNIVLLMVFRTALLSVFVIYLVKTDLPLKEIPYINRFFRKIK